MQKIREKICYLVVWTLSMLFFPMQASAQGLTLSPSGSGFILPSNLIAYGIIGLRLILVFLLLYAGMVAYKAGYDWLYWEGNALKADVNKKLLAKALVFITILFFVLVIFRVLIGGDYSSLVL